MPRLPLPLVFILTLGVAVSARGEVVEVAGDAALRAALKQLRPGTRLRIAPGRYAGNIFLTGVQGTREQPIVIEGADPQNPPHFANSDEGWHLSDCCYLALRNLVIRQQRNAGVHIDDAGSIATPSHHVMLDRLRISHLGPAGMADGIKLTGVDMFMIRNCEITGWSGSGINLLGSHHGIVAGCTLAGQDGFTEAVGIQTKGGASAITIRNCQLHDAGVRAIQIGGRTGLKFLRPANATSEAKDIRVEKCLIVGSETAIAFVGVDGATVRHNTLYHPGRWPIRILQESQEARFVPARNGRFEDNLVVYRHADLETMVNIGRKTEPGSFRFARNAWYSEDRPAASRPTLPTPETAGLYGLPPAFRAPEQGNFQPQNPALQNVGATAP